jgi:diadenosine tetraphosphatase ApaH/serine/threonine PP2A family protein phosphatase
MFCGKMMKLLGTMPDLKLWACSPLGCGRLYLEDTKDGLPGTWFLAEVNDDQEAL